MSYQQGPRGGFAGAYQTAQSQTQQGVQRAYTIPGAAQVWAPNFKQGKTVVRPLPAPIRLPDGTQVWSPYRNSLDPNDFGSWIKPLVVARSVGTPSISFVVSDLNPDNPESNSGESPLAVLRGAIAKAVAAKEDRGGVAGLLQGSANKGAEIPKLQNVAVFYATLHEHGDRKIDLPIGMALDKEPLLFEVTSVDKMVSLFNAVNYQADPAAPLDDWERRMTHGDPVAWQHGRYITFYNLAHGDPRKKNQMASAGWDQEAMRAAAAAADGGSGRNDQIGYGVYIEATHNNRSASFAGKLEEQFQHRLRPIDEIIRVPSWAEQAEMLSTRLPPAALMYGWADHPQWISETVRRRHSASVIVTPAASGNSAWPPSPPPAPAGAPTHPASPWGGAPATAAQPASQPWGGAPAAAPAPAAPTGFWQPAPEQVLAAAPVGEQPGIVPSPQAASQFEVAFPDLAAKAEAERLRQVPPPPTFAPPAAPSLTQPAAGFAPAPWDNPPPPTVLPPAAAPVAPQPTPASALPGGENDPAAAAAAAAKLAKAQRLLGRPMPGQASQG